MKTLTIDSILLTILSMLTCLVWLSCWLAKLAQLSKLLQDISIVCVVYMGLD